MYLMAFAAVFTACKDPMAEITNADYPRAFSPVGLKVTPATFDVATVTWNVIDGATSYELELSQGDSLLFNNIIATYETESLSQIVTGLIGETQYSIRIKANSFRDGQEDSNWYGVAFKSPAEQIFNAVASADIKTSQMTVHWTPNAVVTKLTVTPDIGDIILTPEDIAAGMKTITGLTPVTQYTISIYNGTQRRGMVTATTKWRPSGDGVVELSLDDDLRTAIADPANVGKIIFLPEGYNYVWSGGTTAVGGFTIYGDPDGDLPIITCSAGTPLAVNGLTSGTDVIHFENVEFDCTNASGYFINQGTDAAGNACHIQSLSFENCVLSGFARSLVRTQALNESFDTIRVNNCVIENRGIESGQNYAVIQSTVAFDAFPNIIFSNTTVNVSHAGFLTISGGVGQPSGNNVLIQNCTFYKTVGSNSATSDNRFFIDAGNNGPVNITINNCIFGSVVGVGNERGYRMNAAGAFTSAGNYATTDWTTVEDLTQTPPMQNIPVSMYNGSCANLFVDPDNGNFHFKDVTFEGKSTAGDPRWW